MLGILVAYPWLAVVPALGFLLLSRRVAARTGRAAGVAWLLYVGYESLMKARVLCSGECNIRVDLLLIYPVLLVMSLAALVRAARARRTPS